MMTDPKVWIGDIVGNDRAEQVYIEWQKRQQSMSYMFKSELGELDDDFNSNIIVKDGQHPKLLRLYNSKRIGLETLVIIDDLVKVFPYWDKKITDKIVYPSINRFVSKCKPFVQYDRDKMKNILLTKFSHNT